MSKIIEFLPPAVFFLLYKFFNIFVATIGISITTLILTVIEYIRDKKISKLSFINLIVLIVMGGMTIISQDATFIKMKVTLIYFALSTFLLVDLFFLKKFFIAKIYEPIFSQMKITVTDLIFKNLTIQWIILLGSIAIANEYIWRNFSEVTWVNFKIFAVPSLMIATILINVLYLNYSNNQL